MGIPMFLAMTAAELTGCESCPAHMAWMACHFSPYGTGLSNLPADLPKDSIIIINDRIPIFHHYAGTICSQLEDVVERLNPAGILLDFQRADHPETLAVAAEILQTLPCPVGISAHYAQDFTCPIFLPPVAVNMPLAQHLQPWQGREIWLEVDTAWQEFQITAKGCNSYILPSQTNESLPHSNSACHCHYKIQSQPDIARFLIGRTPEDLQALLGEAETSGVTKAFGLYQQFSE